MLSLCCPVSVAPNIYRLSLATSRAERGHQITRLDPEGKGEFLDGFEGRRSLSPFDEGHGGPVKPGRKAQVLLR